MAFSKFDCIQFTHKSYFTKYLDSLAVPDTGNGAAFAFLQQIIINYDSVTWEM